MFKKIKNDVFFLNGIVNYVYDCIYTNNDRIGISVVLHILSVCVWLVSRRFCRHGDIGDTCSWNFFPRSKIFYVYCKNDWWDIVLYLYGTYNYYIWMASSWTYPNGNSHLKIIKWMIIKNQLIIYKKRNGNIWVSE